MSAALAKIIGAFTGDIIAYLPYDINDTKIFYGVPPVKMGGFDFVSARHTNPQSQLVMSLGGGGVFVENINKAGVIEIGLLNGALSAAAIQIMELTGIPTPITITDLSSKGTSTVFGAACKLIGTPEWRRDLQPSLTIYTFECPNLLVSQGVRLPA